MKSKVLNEHYENTKISDTEDIFNGRYFYINKRLLVLVGQWPYQSVRQRTAISSMIIIFSVTGLGPQLRSMIATWGHLDLFGSCVTSIFVNVGCLGMLLNSMHHIAKLRRILDETKKNWECTRQLKQQKILQNHGENGRKFTIMYSVLIYITTLAFVTSPLLPKILDRVIPLNESRQRFDVFTTDYAVDPNEYFWVIFFHIGLGTILLMTVLVAIDSFYMILAQHVCGMFKILRYDLENIITEDTTINNVTLKPQYDADFCYHQIVTCMKRHKCLLAITREDFVGEELLQFLSQNRYVNSLQGTCEWILFVGVGLSLAALSFTGYQAVAKNTPKHEAIRSALFAIAQTFHLYCITLPGHWISSASSFLPDSAYSCKWYMMSVRSRRLMLVFLRASIQPCTITVGKVYVMSVENFCTVVKTSFSYLTMLISMQ